MSRHCRFTHDMSLEVSGTGFRIYGTGIVPVQTFDLEPNEVDHTCDAVNLTEGVVHIYGRQYVYEVRYNVDTWFTVSKIGPRWA